MGRQAACCARGWGQPHGSADGAAGLPGLPGRGRAGPGRAGAVHTAVRPEGGPALCYTRAMQRPNARGGQGRHAAAEIAPAAAVAAALEDALLPLLPRTLHEAPGAVHEPPGTPAVMPCLVVAVSGGQDSMVLLDALCALQQRAEEGKARVARFGMLVAHFDHGLRPASAEDAAFVADWADRYLQPCLTERWVRSGAGDSGSLEADARAARYAFLARAVAHSLQLQAGAPATQIVLTAHHADDQAETLLLNLLRGSGVAGLAAMRSPAPLPGAPQLLLVRPFLQLARATLQRYAEAARLEWRDDESNDDSSRTRNLLRHELLPRLEAAHPGVRARLLHTAQLMADAADRLDAGDAALLASLCIEQRGGERVRLNAEALTALPRGDRRALLRHALLRTFPTHAAPSYETIDALAAAAAETRHAHGPHPLGGGLGWTLLPARGAVPAQLSLHRLDALPLPPPGAWLDAAWRAAVGSLPLPAQGTLHAGGGRLHVETLSAAAFPGRDAVAAATRWHAWLDAACAPLTLTTPAAGARMAPLGMGGHTRTLGNLFTDGHVAPALRPGWPVLVNSAGEVVWLCGMVVAHSAAVTAQSERVLHLRWETDSGA